MSTPPRRLAILPCHESYADMAEAEDGSGARRCDRCACRVNDAASLDRPSLDALLDRAKTERVCLRTELVEGRPRLAAGVAAGLVVAALAGCATPSATTVMPEPGPTIESVEGEGVAIGGLVKDSRTGEPIANAIVVLQATSIFGQLERMTNARGRYKFTDLPAGNYTIQVLAGQANVSKVAQLPEGAKFRANFSLDPNGADILMGLIVEKRRVPLDASSTYHSSMIEIP